MTDARDHGRATKTYNRFEDMRILDALPPSMRHAINYANFPMPAFFAAQLAEEHGFTPSALAKRMLDWRGITPGAPSLDCFSTSPTPKGQDSRKEKTHER